MARINYVNYKNDRVMIRDSKEYFWDQVIIGKEIPIGMGSIQVSKGKKGLILTRFSSSGNVNYERPLFPGWTVLTPGGAYSPLPSSKEKDPIKKILRKYGQSISKLEIVPAGESVVESGISCDLREWTGDVYSQYYRFDGETKSIEDKIIERDPYDRFGRHQVSKHITEFFPANYLVIIKAAKNFAGITHHIVQKIYVWENADLEKLERGISSLPGTIPPWESGERIETVAECWERCIKSGIKKIIKKDCKHDSFAIEFNNGESWDFSSKEKLDDKIQGIKNIPEVIDLRKIRIEKEEKERIERKEIQQRENKKRAFEIMGLKEDEPLPEDLITAVKKILPYMCHGDKGGIGIKTPMTEEDYKIFNRYGMTIREIRSHEPLLLPNGNYKILNEFQKTLRPTIETLVKYNLIYTRLTDGGRYNKNYLFSYLYEGINEILKITGFVVGEKISPLC